MTKVGAGSTGTVDPTEYVYNSTNGVLTKVRFTSGTEVNEETFEFDGMLRVTRMRDWLNPLMGIQYRYDSANQLIQLVDYDRAMLCYYYDNVGRVTSQIDYHDNTTTYTYTARNELSTLTAPGSRVWDFDYNALGQPTGYTHPNGLTTEYSYDGQGRMTKIDHKNGATSLARFTYALDAGGLISRVTQVDGSYWDYLYDNRYRLTKADRYHSGGNVNATYQYTYDAGDNMITKVEPYLDDFSDGTYSGWTVASGSWDASATYLKNTVRTGSAVTIATTDANNEVRLRYLCEEQTDANSGAAVYFRCSSGSYAYARIQPTQMQLMQYSGGQYTTFQTNTNATSSYNTWYNLRIVADGANIQVYRNQDGAMEELVLSTTAATVTSTQMVRIGMSSSCTYRFDDIRIIADDLSNTTAFAVNNANELTSMTDPNGTTTFGFDAWGRMTNKSRGSYSATYGYKYGQMLCSVTSNWPGEGNVSYNYGGNMQRRERTVGSVMTKYRFSAWGDSLNQEDANQTPLLTRCGGLVSMKGQNPSTGSASYPLWDWLGSLRLQATDDGSVALSGEYTPYGTHFRSDGERSDNIDGFGGLGSDPAVSLYSATYRFYEANSGRWLTRDPAAFVYESNLYQYCESSPTLLTDPIGLYTSLKGCVYDPPVCAALGGVRGFGGSAAGNAAGQYLACGNVDIMQAAWAGFWGAMPGGVGGYAKWNFTVKMGPSAGRLKRTKIPAMNGVRLAEGGTGLAFAAGPNAPQGPLSGLGDLVGGVGSLVADALEGFFGCE